MKVLVPMKRVADPDNANKVKIVDGKKVSSEGLEWKPNPFDEYAVETALRLLENAATQELRGEIVVATIGQEESTQQVRQCLAMGADRGIIVKAEDDALDATVVARTLAKIVQKEGINLVIMGKQAVDGDSNQTAQILAEMLGWPQATFAGKLEAPADLSSVTVTRSVDGGSAKVKVKMPAVISVDTLIVTPEAVKNNVSPADKPYQDGPRYASLKGIMKAKKKPIDVTTFEALGVDTSRRVNTIGFFAPSGRKAGIVVETVEELVRKLKDDAKVL